MMETTCIRARLLSVSLVIGILLALFSAFPLSSAASSGAFSQWKTEGWTESAEDGVPVLKGQDGAGMNLLYLNGTAEGNTLKFDIRMDSSYGTVDGNIGAAFKMANGDQYFFEYNTVAKINRIRRLGADGSDNHVCPAQAYELALDTWYTFEIHCEPGLIRWSIDGEVIRETTETGKDDFTGGTAYIQAYFVCPTLRNITIDSKKVDIVEKQDYDFEFLTADSVKSFTADRGTVAWKDGKLLYTLSGSGTRLVSPAISAQPGTAYSAMLPLRNTLLVRMKNNTDASSVRLWYTTTNSTSYREKQSAVFPVEPQSDFTTYFLNISSGANLTGYLYGFAIEPIGAESGSMEIEAVTFEREAAFCDYAGTIDSCRAEDDQVIIKGTLNPAHAGKTVKLYETVPENYTESLRDNEVIAEVKADGTSFAIEVPFKNGNVSRLSSLFLVGVDGVRVSDRFTVENYADFTENPYAFDLPAYTVSVLDFGAKGDAFTNDNAAIQAAIDHVSAKGGGTVVLPGDDSRYGRRYIATNIKIKDNVELRIEKGAVVWQSQRASDYDYEVAYGHDITISGVNWTHAASCHNLPLIHGDKAKNIKLTGGGTIRSMDAGGENDDTLSASSIWIGCENKIHLVPIGMYACENVEIRGVHLRRTNNYHVNLRTCRNVYVGDISMFEAACASGDGISATVGTKNMVIERSFIFSNDDAITICSTYDDPRGIAWWHANPQGDNCIDNLVIRHNNLNAGHGVTFITWGTDNPDLSKQEIKNIEIYDNVLDGGISAVGTWPDNPYFGKNPYDNTETNDYSPVKNVRMYNNKYRAMTTLECIRGTNIITDNSIRSAADFQYGDFERGLRRYPDFVTGLSNWTELPTEGKSGSVSVGGDKKNHYGIIQGADTLVQGLWMNRGEHTFTVDTKFASGTATVIVMDAVSGRMIAEQAAEASADFATQTVTFTMEKGSTAYLGIRYEGGASDALWLDNASVTSETFTPSTYFTESFDDPDTCQMTNLGFAFLSDGDNTVAGIPEGRSGLMKLTAESTYTEFDLHFRARYDACLSDIDANLGISLLRGSGGNDQYDLHYNPIHHQLNVRRYQNGSPTTLDSKTGFDLPVGEWVDMALRVQDGRCLWYMNGEKLTEFEVKGVTRGQIMLAAYNIGCAFDDVVIAEVGTTVITGDENIPEETKPEETKPEETDPAETQPAETQPAETQPAETDPSETQPAESQPVETNPTDTAPADMPSEPSADSAPDRTPSTEKPSEAKGCGSLISGRAGALLLGGGWLLLRRRRRNR